jgi:histidinol-phosphate/aromatic aminotransferase/cobyric acid decarboxylase-like protein/ribosomal protein S18 acetylase RimI-like enzyme
MAAVRRLRHEAYARELRQHVPREDGELPDVLDGRSTYLVARCDGQPVSEVAGFVSITPPSAGLYSVERDVPREELPFSVDEGLFEVRMLTVAAEHRGSRVALLLMLAALRATEDAGATRVVIKGRDALVGMYERAGLHRIGRAVVSGAVRYEVMTATTAAMRTRATASRDLLARLVDVDWQLPFPREPVVGCFHGGASWDAVGAGFDDLGARSAVVPADVLDAWFPPAPGVLAALAEDPAWLLRTSPPTDAAGMLAAVARVRGVDPASLLPGAGSSALVFLALGRWLSPDSRVLLLDPTYGEYEHVLRRVVGARVDALPVERCRGYRLDPADLVRAATAGQPYDLVVLVNPNSPTGQHVPRAALEAALGELPAATRVWVDETYVDYAGPDQSLERFAAASASVVVVKSMSKAYALSGARVAYLCGPADVVADLRRWTPPWAVSLPGQVAAVRALADPAYYAGRWQHTGELREDLAGRLRALGLDVLPGSANFLLAHLPAGGPDAAAVTARCRARGVYLRDAGATSSRLGAHALRVAVRGPADDARVVEALTAALA